MDERRVDRIARLSILVALVGPIVIAFNAVSSRLGFAGDSSLRDRVETSLFVGAGSLAILLGIVAVVRIARGHRRGMIRAIVAIVLGALALLLGLAEIALSQIQLFPSDRPFL